MTFQAIYGLRQGNVPTPGDAGEMVERGRRRVFQSKLLITALLAGVALFTELLLSVGPQTSLGQGIDTLLFRGAVLTGALVLVMTFLWWTSLQLLPLFYGGASLAVLETLPVPAPTRDRVALIVLFRLVDAPVIAVLVLLPIAVGLALHSPLAALATLPGVFAAIVVALSLSLRSGRFFARSVQGAPGGRRSTLLRWAYLAVWTLPVFAMYALVVFGLAFFRYLDVLLSTGQYGTVTLLASIFPFPLALFPLLLTAPTTATIQSIGFDPLFVVLAAVVYLLIVIFLAFALVRAPRRLLATVSNAQPSSAAGTTRIKASTIGGAIIRKDLRVASRTPSFAFLLLLPALDAVAVGLYTYFTNPPSANAFALGSATVASAALLVTFFGPAFFAIEVLGYSYSRSLPMPRRSLLVGKVALIVLVYLVASGIVLALTLARVFDPGLFILFVVAMLPAVIAAGLLELSVLLRVARKSGMPIVNFYSGAWWATLVAIPGIIIVLAPLAVFYVVGTGAAPVAVTAMAGLAVAELAVCAVFALGLRGRGSL